MQTFVSIAYACSSAGISEARNLLGHIFIAIGLHVAECINAKKGENVLFTMHPEMACREFRCAHTIYFLGSDGIEVVKLINDERLIFGAFCYAAKVTLAAFGKLLQVACREITWLGDCAKMIASGNQPLRWATPLDLLFVRLFFKTQRHDIRTSLQVLALQHKGDSVEDRKQRTVTHWMVHI